MSSLLEGIIEICVTMSTRKINKSSAVRQKKKNRQQSAAMSANRIALGCLLSPFPLFDLNEYGGSQTLSPYKRCNWHRRSLLLFIERQEKRSLLVQVVMSIYQCFCLIHLFLFLTSFIFNNFIQRGLTLSSRSQLLV